MEYISIFIFSSLSFINVLVFSVHNFHIHWSVKFVPKYLILFDGVVNGIVLKGILNTMLLNEKDGVCLFSVYIQQYINFVRYQNILILFPHFTIVL